MKTLHSIRPELRNWILNTTRAGHGPAEVLRLMETSGYSLHDSRKIVAQVLKMPLSAVPDLAQPTTLRGIRTRHPTAPLVDVSGQQVRVSLAVDKPPLRVLENLLLPAECNELIAAATPRLDRALTVDQQGKQQVDQRRTSVGMFFRTGETPLIERIEARLAELLGVPVEHGEGLQVLHYLPSQQYEPHFDWFDPSQPGFASITAHSGQRIASVVMYLNTPDAGGGTGFPELGLTVTAMQGSAVYFAYETGDQASLHAGLPVERGEKWIATKWLRERPYRG